MVQEINRKRVLFVDAEQTIRLTLPPILARRGFDITSVATLRDALVEIHTEQFDILLTDLSLPKVNSGFTVIEEMRKAQPGCINFILTGYPADEILQRAVTLEVAHFFIKPVEIEAMISIIKQKLAGHSPAMSEDTSGPGQKYAWQQVVFDAFIELRPEYLPPKINAAEHAISARLRDSAPVDLDERIALQDALQSLRARFLQSERQESEAT